MAGRQKPYRFWPQCARSPSQGNPKTAFETLRAIRRILRDPQQSLAAARRHRRDPHTLRARRRARARPAARTAAWVPGTPVRQRSRVRPRPRPGRARLVGRLINAADCTNAAVTANAVGARASCRAGRMQSIAGTGSPSMDGATPYRTPPGKDPCSSDTFTTPPPPPRRTPRATKTDHPESNVLSVLSLLRVSARENRLTPGMTAGHWDQIVRPAQSGRHGGVIFRLAACHLPCLSSIFSIDSAYQSSLVALASARLPVQVMTSPISI